MSSKDYYEALGLPRSCTAGDVKKAFRKLALQYHPDKNQSIGAIEKFKLLNEAQDTLTDPARRLQYDLDHPIPRLSSNRSSDSSRFYSSKPHSYDNDFDSSGFNAFPSETRYGPNETPFTHRHKNKNSSSSSSSNNRFYPGYSFGNNDFFNEYFTQYWEGPQQQRDHNHYHHHHQQQQQRRDKKFNFRHWTGYEDYFDPSTGSGSGPGYDYGSGSFGSTRQRQSSTRDDTTVPKPPRDVPVEKESNFKKTKDGWGYTSTSYSYVSGEKTSSNEDSASETSSGNTYKFSMKGKFSDSTNKNSQGNAPSWRSKTRTFHKFFTSQHPQEHQQRKQQQNQDDVGETESENKTETESNNRKYTDKRYSKFFNQPKESSNSYHSQSTNGEKFVQVPVDATVIDLTTDGDSSKDQPTDQPAKKSPEIEEIQIDSPPLSTSPLETSPDFSTKADTSVDQAEVNNQSETAANNKTSPSYNGNMNNRDNIATTSIPNHEHPPKRHVPTPTKAENIGSPPKRHKSNPVNLDGYEKLMEDFTKVPPFTQTSGNFNMEELSKNIPDQMMGNNNQRNHTMSSPTNDKPLPPSPVASSDNEREFHTPSPNLHEPNGDVSSSFPKDNISSDNNYSSNSNNNNTERPEEPMLDLHDSLLVFEIRPPDPPALPPVTASSTELLDYGKRIESYQKEWNEYSLKMCQYHDERVQADISYDIQYYMSTAAMQRYIQAMVQDIEVKHQWQLAQHKHCEVLQNFLKFKLAQEGQNGQSAHP